MCNKGCGVNLGIGQHLLGTMKEWMILNCYTCSKCKAEMCKECAVEQWTLLGPFDAGAEGCKKMKKEGKQENRKEVCC
jgi:hypothetical protein